MIDLLKLSIPFLDKYVYVSPNSKNGITESIDIREVAKFTGMGMCSGGIYSTGDGFEVSDLQHAFDSLPSHFTGVAFKIFQGTHLRPACVELKASPAKIIQGHNVFGGTSIEQGAQEMIACLLSSHPLLFSMLDIVNTSLDMIDVTYSASMENETLLKQAISHFKNVSNGQMRTAVKNEFDTTCYFNKGSRHVDRKVYMKYPEFSSQLKKFEKLAKTDKAAQRTFETMSDPRLQNFARNLLRFEARCKRRFLDNFKMNQEIKLWDELTQSYKINTKETAFPVKLTKAIEFQKEYEKNGESLIVDMWKKAFTPLLKSLEGTKMNVYDDDAVLQKLIGMYETTTKSGAISHAKAKRLHTFYRSILSMGFTTFKSGYSTVRSFNMNLKDLCAIGIDRASLQQMSGKSNVNEKPVLQIVNINFNSQFPSWFVADEPPMTKLLFGENGHEFIADEYEGNSDNVMNAVQSEQLETYLLDRGLVIRKSSSNWRERVEAVRRENNELRLLSCA